MASADVSVVAIFGPTDPEVCDRVRVVAGGLDEITVEQVLDVVQQLMNESGSQEP